jgi:hypothetical protein
VWFFDPAELAARTGEVHWWLGRSDPQYAEEALRHSTQAITGYESGKVRSRALAQADLAAGHALAGDSGQAVIEGHRALAAAGELRSRRLLDRLATLPADLAEHRATLADVSDLVHDIRAARRSSIGRGSAGSGAGQDRRLSSSPSTRREPTVRILPGEPRQAKGNTPIKHYGRAVLCAIDGLDLPGGAETAPLLRGA